MKTQYKGLIDLHCHILPSLDDGPKEMQEALGMARMAEASGTHLLLATPHIHPGVYNNTPTGITRALQLFRAQLREAGIGLQVQSAAEVRLSPKVLGLIRSEQAPFLNQSGARRYLLLELPHRGIPPGAVYMVELIVRFGVVPVLAHPERIRCVRKNIEALEPFMAMGCLSQVTAGSLCGAFGNGVRQTADALLKRGWCHLLASDGHGYYNRQPVLVDGLLAVEKLMGFEKAQLLGYDVPQAIYNGQDLSGCF
ncbi:MAG: hypothetical protein H7832_13625 [Magnetococcus sp. DMHC-6]